MAGTVDAMVESLLAAYRTQVPTSAMHDVADLDQDTAYLIQRRVFQARFGAGQVRGYKIGLATHRDQQALGTDRPVYGQLAEENFVSSPATITVAGLFCPIIEPEVVFLFDEDVSAGASLAEITEKSRVGAGFDLPDSRYLGWPALAKPIATDLIADNSCIGLIVHAEPTVRAAEIDLRAMVCTMTVNGQLLGTGKGSDVSGNPAMLVVWLSKTLSERGLVLRKGDRVSSGAVVSPSPLKVVEPGRYVAEFTGIGTVRVDVAS